LLGSPKINEPSCRRPCRRGLPYTALRDAIFTHPTMAEGLNVLFANAPLPKSLSQSSLSARLDPSTHNP
jgi:hypothetical protein